METIIYLLKFVLFCFALAVVTAIIWFLVTEYRDYQRKQRFEEARYLALYRHIQAYLECNTSQEYYNYLRGRLEYLGQLPYKNREMTEVLTVDFFERYKEYAKAEVKES